MKFKSTFVKMFFLVWAVVLMHGCGMHSPSRDQMPREFTALFNGQQGAASGVIIEESRRGSAELTAFARGKRLDHLSALSRTVGFRRSVSNHFKTVCL